MRGQLLGLIMYRAGRFDRGSFFSPEPKPRNLDGKYGGLVICTDGATIYVDLFWEIDIVSQIICMHFELCAVEVIAVVVISGMTKQWDYPENGPDRL